MPAVFRPFQRVSAPLPYLCLCRLARQRPNFARVNVRPTVVRGKMGRNSPRRTAVWMVDTVTPASAATLGSLDGPATKRR
jgi:hypothetical protein